MTEDQDFIYESLKNQVRSGFYSKEEIQEEILEEIEDNEFQEEISEEWTIEKIENEIEKVTNESKHWKNPTDTQKLINAFDELHKNNFIALHNAGYTYSEGEQEVIEVEWELIEKGGKSEGYCFYHSQDLDGALGEEPSLHIAFNKIDNTDDEVTISVGKKIVEIFKKHNLDAEWNEKPTARILLPNFKWQYLYDENGKDLLDYEDIIETILKK